MHVLYIGVGLLVLQACGSGPGPDPGSTLSADERLRAIERGEAIAQASFAALSGRLQQAMAEGGPIRIGPAHAVDYCWSAAAPIADSMGVVHAAHVKRTSDHLRSPANKPDAHEQGRLDAIIKRLETGTRPSELEAEVHLLGDSIAFYKPILIASPLCLSCHGVVGAGLDSSAYAVIQERYPNDRAIGYDEVGGFRGLWSVRWPR